jgi:peptidoglycan L-alanyl-D-glutamate endopeptidase CwlK
MVLSERSKSRLQGVHPDLVKVVMRAVEIATERGLDFGVTEGVRDVERQKQLVAEGKSWTMTSRHIPSSNACKMSCAVDLAAFEDGKLTWDYRAYLPIVKAMKDAADELGIKIQAGADWKQKDFPHFELHRDVYPYAKR